MKIYSDLESEYMILDYHPTHSKLLLRSLKNKHRSYNIDILISPVFFLLIPARIKGIEIALVEDQTIINELKTFYDVDIEYYKIFSLTDSNKRTYYINAGGFNVYRNEFHNLESYLEKIPYVSPGERILLYK